MEVDKPAANSVAKCKRALAGLRKLYDDQNPIVDMARSELAKAERDEKAQMAPEDILRSALDRQCNCKTEADKYGKITTELQAKLENATTKRDEANTQLVAVNAEVAQARLALAPDPEAGLAGAAETVAALQRILQGAHDSITAGQDRNTVGGSILDQLVGHVRKLGDAVPHGADSLAAGGQPPGAATPGQVAAAAAQGAPAAPAAAAGPPAARQLFGYVPTDAAAASWENS